MRPLIVLQMATEMEMEMVVVLTRRDTLVAPLSSIIQFVRYNLFGPRRPLSLFLVNCDLMVRNLQTDLFTLST